MNTNTISQQNNIIPNGTLNKSFDWFEKIFFQAVTSALQEFWEVNLDFKLISVSQDDNFFFSGSEYFVTRIKLTKKHQAVIRISKEVVKILLDNTLGQKEKFDFEKLTELEAKILTAFNNLIFENFSTNLVNKDEIEDIDGEVHLTFLVKNTNDLSKIILTIPAAFLKPENMFMPDPQFDIGDFPTAKVNVGLYVGSTTLLLNDLKNIEKEDIIVLENSNINTMTLKFNDYQTGFKVSPDPSLIISFDDDDNNGSKNMSKSDNIWDNIQVDISAEFEKVKISLGEIKQISEGLVVDVGSIYDNKIDLKVENKVIAKGELVIINDRYGVRIEEVVKDEETQAPENEPTEAPVEEPQDTVEMPQEPEAEPQPNEENPEDFDYKDFDVDDENI